MRLAAAWIFALVLFLPAEKVVAQEKSDSRPGEESVDFTRHHSSTPYFFTDFNLATNDVAENIVVIGGNAEIAGIVEGDLVVVGGSVKISGKVHGDAVVVMGGVEMLSGAVVSGDTSFIGGPFKIPAGATIRGDRNHLPIGDVGPKVEWFKQWLLKGLLWGRLLPGGVNWAWSVAIFFSFVYLLLLLLFPNAVKTGVIALEERPVTSMAAGMLVLVLFAPLVFLLVVSVVGIIVIPFLVLAFILLGFFGKISVLCMIGRALARNTGWTWLLSPLPSFILGLIILVVAYALPVLGIISWAVTTVMGLGAAVVALSGTFQREDKAPPAAVSLAALKPRPADAGSISPSAPANPSPTATHFGVIPGSGVSPADTIYLPRAGFWSRVAAAILDLILISLLIPVTGPFTIPVAVAYFVAMWTWKGTTIGSMIMGLKVVRTDGTPVNFTVALVRSLSSLFSVLVLFLGFFWAAWDRDKQAWHDKIAGTVVVRMPKEFALV